MFALLDHYALLKNFRQTRKQTNQGSSIDVKSMSGLQHQAISSYDVVTTEILVDSDAGPFEYTFCA